MARTRNSCSSGCRIYTVGFLKVRIAITQPVWMKARRRRDTLDTTLWLHDAVNRRSGLDLGLRKLGGAKGLQPRQPATPKRCLRIHWHCQ